MNLKKIIRVASITILLLLIPFIAMFVTDEMNWSAADFVVAGVLVFSAGIIYEWLSTKGSSIIHRTAVALAVITSLGLLWVNLAVGLIGNENNPANTLYLGVIAIGLIGLIVARFKTRALQYVLYAMAIAQAAVPVIAYFIWKPQFVSAINIVQVIGVNTFFVLLFAVSGLLFRQASRIEVQ